MSKTYVDRVVDRLRRSGHAPKYEHPGIYCIKVDDRMVYVGKSVDMLERVAQHIVGVKQESERKYRILNEVQRKGHTINFDVLYYAQEKRYADIEEEIGQKEGEYIRKYRPLLNTQIPKAEDWRKYDVQIVDAREVLQQLL